MGSTLNPDIRTITEAEVAKFALQVEKKSYKRLDYARALQLRIRDKLTYEEIAERLGTTAPHVHGAIHKFLAFLEDPGNLYAYQENKPDLLEAIELKLLAYLADLLNSKKCTSVKDLSLALKVVGDMVRLNKGQSTSNVSLLLKSIEEAHQDPLSTDKGSGVEGNAITSSATSGTPSQDVLRAPLAERVSSPAYLERGITCETSPSSGSSTNEASSPDLPTSPDLPEPIAMKPSPDSTE